MWQDLHKVNFIHAMNYAALSCASALTLILYGASYLVFFSELQGGAALALFTLGIVACLRLWVLVEDTTKIRKEYKELFHTWVGLLLPFLLVTVEAPGAKSLVDAFGLGIVLGVFFVSVLFAGLSRMSRTPTKDTQ